MSENRIPGVFNDDEIIRKLAEHCPDIRSDEAVIRTLVDVGVRPSQVANRLDAIKHHAQRLLDGAGEALAAAMLTFGGVALISLFSLV